MYAEVMRENKWLSRSIEVAENQKVVSTGLYGTVRHPMYTATIGMFLVMLPYIPVIMVRIKDEEALLTEQLAGYSEYKHKVRWRLIPFSGNPFPIPAMIPQNQAAIMETDCTFAETGNRYIDIRRYTSTSQQSQHIGK